MGDGMTVTREKGFIVERDASGKVTNLVRAKAITMVTRRPTAITNDHKEIEGVTVTVGGPNTTLWCSADHLWSLLRTEVVE
jgi:hypothetical protein